ncbi:MAG: gamma-glutamyltransferase [Micavibrio aeruginosavorus]|uniref:Glutathione hydrolase proenzyme n=1 Tax=Micavibrio aeruginosavorus TaxID=349221 RepID=A0A2W5N1U0_9BACT|nr:MAG: gamma-glutamyltransferase [Micavibrio aeruginosavorus]
MCALAALLIVLPIQGVSAQNYPTVPGVYAAPSTPEPSTPVQAGSSANGSRIMVVTAHPEATKVGYDVLKRGGSAADAAVAVQLMLGLVEPQSSGLGGGGFALYYDARTKQLYSFDGRETAPATAGRYLFTGEDGKPMEFYDAAIGGRSVGVPGTVKLLEMLHKRFGRMPWRDLFSPAIGVAETGFTVTPRLASLVEYDYDNLREFTPTQLYFFPDAVTPINEGGRLVNPLYGGTLRKIAIEGADGFYKGDIAEAIVKAVREDDQNPGLLAIEDLANYEAIERKTICSTYRAYLVCTMPEPTSGGLTLLMTLGILENFDLAGKGPTDPEAWHLISEASRLAFADRNYYMADPHYVSTPGERLLDKAYLKSRAALISPAQAAQKIMPGTPPGWGKKEPAAEPVYPKPPGTTHFTIVDAAGNIVSMTDSVEDLFGSRMMVHGFVLNNQLTDFSFVPEVDGKAVANRVEGGKRPRSTMTPVIIFSPDGKPFLVIGSAGGSAIVGYVLERIIELIDWKQTIVGALASPNILNRGKGIEMEKEAYYLEDALRAKGHPVEIKDLNSGLTAISFQNGVMTGAADPRREGTAMGE